MISDLLQNVNMSTVKIYTRWRCFNTLCDSNSRWQNTPKVGSLYFH